MPLEYVETDMASPVEQCLVPQRSRHSLPVAIIGIYGYLSIIILACNTFYLVFFLSPAETDVRSILFLFSINVTAAAPGPNPMANHRTLLVAIEK